jgi:hypothetical protein
MLNSFLNTWFIVIIVIIIINIIIRVYKFYRFSYLFSVSIETFINVNGVNILTYFNFNNLYASNYIKWRSRNSFIKIIKTVLYVIYNDSAFITKYSNKNLCLAVFEVNPVNKLFVAIADPVVFKYNDLISANELFNLIKWNNIASNNIRNITIIIRTI